MISIVDTSEENRPYQLILVYCSSGFPHQELVEDLKNILLQDITIIVTGDFNFDKKESNSVTSFLDKSNLKQSVEWPTHKEGRTIDHVYVRGKHQAQYFLHYPYYTDHEAVCVMLKDESKKE